MNNLDTKFNWKEWLIKVIVTTLVTTGRPIEYYYEVVTTYYKDYENGSPSNAYSKKDTAYAKQLLYV